MDGQNYIPFQDPFNPYAGIPTDPRRMDYTGYGPTGVGNAPLPTEARGQSINKYHTNRVAEAMQFIDPYARATTEAAMRIVGEANKQASPAELRRMLYNSAQGQAALDATMLARHAGFIGSGSPVNYAYHVTSGVAAGGFTGNVMDPYGRTIGFNQQLGGNGIVSERVSMNIAQGMLRDLYGSGTPDPSKLYGFNMEDAAENFRALAARGGLGNIGTLKYDANIRDRLSAARMSAVDTGIKAGLSNIDASKLANIDALQDPGERARATDNFMKELNDPKLEREVRGIINSKDAFVINDRTRQQFMDTNREMLKSMSNLKDIYGEMSSPQLRSMLESISGQRIMSGDTAQARRAGVMVENLRNAAESAGMDPRAFMDTVMQMQQGFMQSLQMATGLDSRSRGGLLDANARLTGRNVAYAANAAGVSAETEKLARDMGFDAKGTSRTFDEIAADKAQRQLEMTQKYAGYTAAEGALKSGTLGKADDAKVRAIVSKFRNTTDPAQLAAMESELRGILGGSEGFDAFSKSGVGSQYITLGAGAEDTARTLTNLSNANLNTDALRAQVQQDFKVPTDKASSIAKTLTGKLSGRGLLDMMQASRSGGTKADRLANMRAIKDQAGMTDEEFGDIMDTMFTPEGLIKEGAEKTAKLALQTSRGQESTYEQQLVNRKMVAQLNQKSGSRKAFSDENDRISTKSIINAIATKKVDNLDDAETLGMIIEAHKASGGKVTRDKLDANGNVMKDANGKAIQEDISDMYQSGIDVSGGFTKESLERIRKGSGSNFDLAKALGMSEEELIARTKGGKDASLMVKAYNTLREQNSFGASGGLSNLTVMSDEIRGSSTVERILRQDKNLAFARSLSPGMTGKEYSALEESITSGDGKITKDAIEAAFNVDTKGEDISHHKVKMAHLESMKMKGAAINKLTKEQIASMSEDGTADVMAKKMKEEIAVLRDNMSRGATKIKTFDEKGNTKWEALNEQLIQQFEAVVDKLEGRESPQEQGVAQMRVTNLVVEGEFKAQKK